MRALIAFFSGGLFALGLIVSDMVNPARVIAFLDVTGDRDPTLAFVMIGALIPMAIAWRVAAARTAPACGGAFPGPPNARLDKRLLGGAALFGAGWGLVGFCPGPALTALGTGNMAALLFTVAMLTGMLGHAIAFPTSREA